MKYGRIIYPSEIYANPDKARKGVEGYRITTFRPPKYGELYLTAYYTVEEIVTDFRFGEPRFILERIPLGSGFSEAWE